MSPEDIARDRAICDAATPPPWRRVSSLSEDITGADANFIAAARERWPAYIAEAEEIQRRIDVMAERADMLGRTTDSTGAVSIHAGGMREVLAHLRGEK